MKLESKWVSPSDNPDYFLSFCYWFEFDPTDKAFWFLWFFFFVFSLRFSFNFSSSSSWSTDLSFYRLPPLSFSSFFPPIKPHYSATNSSNYRTWNSCSTFCALQYFFCTLPDRGVRLSCRGHRGVRLFIEACASMAKVWAFNGPGLVRAEIVGLWAGLGVVGLFRRVWIQTCINLGLSVGFHHRAFGLAGRAGPCVHSLPPWFLKKPVKSKF